MRLSGSTLSVLALPLAAVAAFGQNAGTAAIPIGFPTTISQPGSYQLTHNLTLDSSNQVALTVNASGVSINLNGFQISGPGTNTGIGIQVAGASGVEITNGTLSDLGFGIVVSNSSNVTIRDIDIRALGLAVSAPPPETGIMIVESSGVVVNHNNLYSVGLGIFVRGGRSHGNRITDNNVTAGTNGALGICYNPAPMDPAAPSGDYVANNSVYGFPTGISIAATAGAIVLRQNNVFYTKEGIALNGAPVQEIDNTLVALQ